MKKNIIKILIFISIFVSASAFSLNISEAQSCSYPNFLNKISGVCVSQNTCINSNAVSKGSCVGICTLPYVFDSANSMCVTPKTTCSAPNTYVNTAQGQYFNQCLSTVGCYSTNSQNKGSCVLSCPVGSLFDVTNSQCISTPTCNPSVTYSPTATYLNTAVGTYFNSCIDQPHCAAINNAFSTKGSCVLSCPEGQVFDTYNSMCVVPKTTCSTANTYVNTAQGQYFNQCLSTGGCYSSNSQSKGSCALSCPAGKLFDVTNSQCTPTPTCNPPTNYLNTAQGQYFNQCISSPYCAAYNNGTGKGSCVLSCPSGQVFNELNSSCVSPLSCSYPSFLNTVDNTCISPIYCTIANTQKSNSCIRSCDAGQTFNANTNTCINLAPVVTPPPTTTNQSYTSVNNLFVDTNKVDNITNTSATLYGTGGYAGSTAPALPISGYFRYSKAKISPIFCNDIYGTNMTSTRDSELNNLTNSSGRSTQVFSQKITGLTPDTTYYYCAIVSNKDNIAYGGTNVVKQFHTDCYENDTTSTTGVSSGTSIKTNPATGKTSSSALLNGSYCSTKTVTTSFEYRKAGGTQQTEWTKVGDTKYDIGNNSNVYGNITFPNKSGDKLNLTPNTAYQFRAVAKDVSGNIFNGSILNFVTDSKNEPGGGGSSETDACPLGSTGIYPNCSYQTGGSGSSGNGSSGSGYNSGGSGGYGNNGGGYTDPGYTGGGSGSGTGTTPLVLGQTATPPVDTIVRYHEGIEAVFVRQILANSDFSKIYGYEEGTDMQTFAWNLADQFARVFGYISINGNEIRVSQPDVAAYQLQLVGNKLTVYEYYYNKIVDIRNVTTIFKNASGYEYYFKK